ncbi:hypothetical protein P344_04815 [Spiroplasma mirum ATCC 29335]|uniref:Cytosolic endo-beta-N-acetylglucosaminidase TIM barrel domain-containing protein n=1 Tax=Spiroplasma mirum ATCC 29335 TaxID=838561 RepID=W0GLS8_9MOLU|nr:MULTISPECIES: hypothetical protein [Spiroplasma]AHF61200.1 endo-beta-N-acetylglucosaminidase [Spiroplasma mirum ATCC 29335]AHI58285.1 hypothetical protein P344_04815 [Spiroplasma mirum ATCC 29335]AKM53283.1 endo-beta-N-acetylglucosaminidase [Spiroplasma atrichopogonis]
MRKLWIYLSLATIITLPSMLLTSCSIGSVSGNQYLSSLPNFDWASDQYGEGIAFNNTDQHNMLANSPHQVPLGNITPAHEGRYLDYSKFSTGFQWNQNIKKQAVTGVPLNKGFMPNGNYAQDFGVTSLAQKYLRLNSILEWNPATDYDAKYNRSVVPLQPRKYVATYNSSEQNENIKYNQLGFSSRKHRTFDNTIVGTKNPFENTNLNWQYINEYVNWSGSWFEGPIVPPPADVIDAAHVNGTPIFGNVFLDGYHGLTKEMLKDFLAQNSDGSYKIVDILINLAKYNGFDGWFINNEANGAAPNGSILDYNTMYEIIKEFNYKVGTATDPNIKKLKVIYYRNDATVSKGSHGYDDQETIKMTTSGYQKPNGEITPTEIQLNFGEIPDKTVDFLKDNPNYHPSDLHTIIDEGANPKYFGSYDFRQLAYQEQLRGGKPSYNKDVYTSFSTYLDAGAGTFGTDAYNWAKANGVNNPIRAYLFATQVTNLFNTIQFSGTNTFISSNDEGLQSNRFLNDYQGLNPSGSYQRAAFISDPRIKASNKGKVDPFVEQKIYDYQGHGGYNSSSYGIGSLVKEQTTLFDEDQVLNKQTNFSTGSGVQFVERDQNGQPIVANNYPWTNKRLTDILPTYQWKIYDESQRDKPLNINALSGFYDYDTIYQKGNSIAIGSGFNKNGEVLPAQWDNSKVYDWDILGTNLISNNHQVSFIYYDGSDNNSNATVNFWVTTTDQQSMIPTSQSITPDHSEKLPGGWVKIDLNLNKLSNVSSANRIAKIGLQIKPQTNKFKFNVGQFTITTPTTNNNNHNAPLEIKNPTAEYVINRMVNNMELYNIRFGWESTKATNLDYYAIYYLYEGKWYRIGETTQNYYFVKDLQSTNHQITLMIKPVLQNNLPQPGYSVTVNV